MEVVAVIIAFLLTALAGNRLLHRWQLRAWIQQQRFLGQEQEFNELSSLSSEIAGLIGARLFCMRRLNEAVFSQNESELDSRRQEYYEILKRWNERLPGFFVSLSVHAGMGTSIELEKCIQDLLVQTGSDLERLVRFRKSSRTPPREQKIRISRELDRIQARSISFNEALAQLVQSRRPDRYFNQRIVFSIGTLHYFSTWQLFKALFIQDIDSLSISRSSLDL